MSRPHRCIVCYDEVHTGVYCQIHFELADLVGRTARGRGSRFEYDHFLWRKASSEPTSFLTYDEFFAVRILYLDHFTAPTLWERSTHERTRNAL